MYRFESEEDFDDVPPNIFEGIDEIVSKEPKFTNHSIAGVYFCANFLGKDFLADLANFAAIVYHDDTGLCANDMVDKYMYCKFRATCEEHEKLGDKYPFDIPHYCTSENLTKSNIWVRLHFPNEDKGTFDDNVLVFEVGFHKYKEKYFSDAQTVWNDVQDSQYDLLETKLGGFGKISNSLFRAYHIGERVAWRFQD